MNAIVGRFAKLSFAMKIIVLPVLALLALLAVVGITTQLNNTNSERLASIRDGYYPSVQGGRSLQEDLVALQRSFQDAVQENNGLRLRQSDQLALSFKQTLDSLRTNAVADHKALTTIGQNFATYANDGGQFDDVLEFIKRHRLG